MKKPVERKLRAIKRIRTSFLADASIYLMKFDENHMLLLGMFSMIH